MFRVHFINSRAKRVIRSDGDGKRELSRVGFDIEALIHYKTSTIKGTVENISLKGMFIHTLQSIDRDEPVEITINLAGDTSDLSIKVEAVVVRTTESGIGVKFQKVDLNSFIHLRNIVAYNSGDDTKVMAEFFEFVKQHGPYG